MISVLDVEELLPFVKKETMSIEEQIIEEKRVKEELEKFVDLLIKHNKEKFYYIGEEKKFGKHLERYIFHNGGFLEILVEKPVSINAHFLSKKRAEKFCSALKKVSNVVLPESEVKKIFIDSIQVSKPEDSPLTYDKWKIIHSLAIHKTAVYSIVALILFVLFESIETLIEFISSEFFNIKVHILYIDIIVAVIAALSFEPIKIIVTRFIDKIIEKRN